MLSDFPKIHCPFVRKEFPIDIDDWKKYGRELKLRSPKVYLVQPEINHGYEWVFEDKYTIACEKLDGTNIKMLIEKGKLIIIQNRQNLIDPLSIKTIKGRYHILEGVFQSLCKNYISGNGEFAGELIGPKLQGNPYKLSKHIWIPFERLRTNSFRYRSFHEHDRTFDNWNLWFKDYLFSLYNQRINNNKDVMAEGVIFYNEDRDKQGLVCMAKLRRDMFDWYYSHKIRILY
jgi:hypothetical protein